MKQTIVTLLRRVNKGAVMPFVIASLMFPAAIIPQVAGAGNIQGTVTDSSGALAANATVAISNVDTKVTQTTKADSAGVYIFPNITIGTYNLSVSSPGFKTYEKRGIVLEVGSNIAENVALSVEERTRKLKSGPKARITNGRRLFQANDRSEHCDRDAAKWPPTDISDNAVRWRKFSAGRRLHRQQVLLCDHRRLYSGRHGQHHAMETGRWRQQ